LSQFGLVRQGGGWTHESGASFPHLRHAGISFRNEIYQKGLCRNLNKAS